MIQIIYFSKITFAVEKPLHGYKGFVKVLKQVDISERVLS